MLLTSREVVDLFAGRSKSDSAATLGYKVLPSVHHLAVYWIRYLPFHCLRFLEFVSRVALIPAGVVAIFPGCSRVQEPYVSCDSS